MVMRTHTQTHTWTHTHTCTPDRPAYIHNRILAAEKVQGSVKERSFSVWDVFALLGSNLSSAYVEVCIHCRCLAFVSVDLIYRRPKTLRNFVSVASP